MHCAARHRDSKTRAEVSPVYIALNGPIPQTLRRSRLWSGRYRTDHTV